MIIPAYKRSLFLAVILSVPAGLLPPQPADAALDPWYADLGGHWAEQYIRTLWVHDIAEGRPASTTGPELLYRFDPDRTMTRAEFTLALARAFRLEPRAAPARFDDVQPGYEVYPGREAFPLLNSAAEAGIARGDGHAFRPEDSLRREQAVALLTRALGLGQEAARADAAEIFARLRGFKDGGATSPALQPEMALAIRLGIVEGYPDQTLRPGRSMTRAEGAAMIYRSAMFRLHVDERIFSPDGDGRADRLEIHPAALDNGNLKHWRVWIVNSEGEPIAELDARGHPNDGPLHWDGRDALGRRSPAGAYYAMGTLLDRNNQQFDAVPQPFLLQELELEAEWTRRRIMPGESTRLLAITRGGAVAVRWRASGPGLTRIGGDLAPERQPSGDPLEERLWQAELTALDSAPDVTLRILVEARFAHPKDGARERSLDLRIETPRWLEGEVRPDPAWKGSAVRLYLQGSPADRVTARWPWGNEVRAKPSGPGRWYADGEVPDDFPAGPAQVEARAVDERGTLERSIPFDVLEDAREGLIFRLVD